MDIEALVSLGYSATGWDPAFHPSGAKVESDVVNLGYVLNVIERPQERVHVLHDAFQLAQRLLIVSTMVIGQQTVSRTHSLRQRVSRHRTPSRNSTPPLSLRRSSRRPCMPKRSLSPLGFASSFDIRRKLSCSWKDAADDHRLVGNRNPIAILYSGRPRENPGGPIHTAQGAFRRFLGNDSRTWPRPGTGEFDRLAEVKKVAGGVARAFKLAVHHHGNSMWRLARQSREEDILVYLAMTQFRKRFLRRENPVADKARHQSVLQRLFHGAIKSS